MNEPRPAGVVIDDFVGMVSDADPGDIPDGAAAYQLNCGTVRPGELTVRGGLKEVTFDTLS